MKPNVWVGLLVGQRGSECKLMLFYTSTSAHPTSECFLPALKSPTTNLHGLEATSVLPLTALLGAKSRDPVLDVVVALDSVITSAIEPPVVLTAGCRESFHRGGFQIDWGPPSVATSRCWAPFKGGFSL